MLLYIPVFNPFTANLAQREEQREIKAGLATNTLI